MKKFLLLFLSVVLVFTVAGCGKKTEEPDKALSILIDYIHYGKDNDFIKDAYKEKATSAQLREKMEESIVEGSGIDGDAANEYAKIMLDLIAKQTYKVEKISEDGKNAKVKLTTTPIDFEQLLEDAMADVEEDQSAFEGMSQAEAEEASLDLINKKLKDNPPLAEEMTKTFDMVKKNGYWVVDGSPETFEIELLKSFISGME